MSDELYFLIEEMFKLAKRNLSTIEELCALFKKDGLGNSLSLALEIERAALHSIQIRIHGLRDLQNQSPQTSDSSQSEKVCE